jgi:hypothetical protein
LVKDLNPGQWLIAGWASLLHALDVVKWRAVLLLVLVCWFGLDRLLEHMLAPVGARGQFL